jgi:hypothetical protein
MLKNFQSICVGRAENTSRKETSRFSIADPHYSTRIPEVNRKCAFEGETRNLAENKWWIILFLWITKTKNQQSDHFCLAVVAKCYSFFLPCQIWAEDDLIMKHKIYV